MHHRVTDVPSLSSRTSAVPMQTLAFAPCRQLRSSMPTSGVCAVRRGHSHLRGVPGLLRGHSDPAADRSLLVPALLLGGEVAVRELLPHAAAVLREAHQRSHQVCNARPREPRQLHGVTLRDCCRRTAGDSDSYSNQTARCSPTPSAG